MGTPSVTRHRTMMDQKHKMPGVVLFWPEPDEGYSQSIFKIEMSPELYAEMGEPNIITVSVEPGNTIEREDSWGVGAQEG